MAFKIFRRFWDDKDKTTIESTAMDDISPEWYVVNPLPIVKRTKRIGMDKNFRIGKVKRVADDRLKILVDVMEMCMGTDGIPYQANYNIWLTFDKEWKGAVSKDLTGQYVVFGFYLQSFRDKDLSDKFDTICTCRFLNMIPDETTAKSLAIDLMESKLFVEHPYLKLSNIKLK